MDRTLPEARQRRLASVVSSLPLLLLCILAAVVAAAFVSPVSGIAALALVLLACCGSGSVLLHRLHRKKPAAGSAPESPRQSRTRSRPARAPEFSDPETGLPNARQLNDLLRREIARSVRYGDRSTLTVFDVQVAAYQPTADHPEPPSPAPFVAAILAEATREADVVARLDRTHFAVFVTECDRPGAAGLADRIRTDIGSRPYAISAGGSGIYARAWAGAAAWNPAFTEPQAFLDAAFADLERSRPAYDHAQAWFAGVID